MKYSKEYENILNTDTFPPQWRDSAIEYRKLKKLIKNVADELASLGLNPEVLNKILKPEDSSNSTSFSPTELHIQTPGTRSNGQRSFTLDDALHAQELEKQESLSHIARTTSPEVDDGAEGDIEELEFEFEELDDESPSPKGNITSAIIVDDEEDASSSADIRSVTRVAGFRVRLPSHSSVIAPDIDASHSLSPSSYENSHEFRFSSEPWTAKVKAEYVLSGPSEHPTPEIRLFLSSSPRPDELGVESRYDDHTLISDPSTAKGVTRSRFPSSLVRSGSTGSNTSRTGSASSDGEANPQGSSLNSKRIAPSSPRLERIVEAPSPIFAITNGIDEIGLGGLKDDLNDLELGLAALPEEVSGQATAERMVSPHPPNLEELMSANRLQALHSTPQPKSLGMHTREGDQREIVLSIPSDVAFFQLLCDALISLSQLHARQQQLFSAATEHLCKLVSQSIIPQTNQNPIRNIHLPIVKRKGDKQQYDSAHTPGSGSYHKSDLYAWREIFTLWIEAQIFESSAERDRGERSVEAADKRLKAFAAEVVKRGLGDRRTLRRRESREAWEEFLRLNVLLLDLKRFQIANINAARKILKKHDKRTALTASTGFPQFVRSSLEAHIDSKGNVNTWAFYSTSLPHVLLTSLTDTLLPILPSLDDYTCLICTSIAFKPIRLSCSHLFCVRCLAKMQRAGNAECPLCRAKTVLKADRSSLDHDMVVFMEKWFPLEVKKKQKDNELEIAKTEMQDIGLDGRCNIM